MSHAATIRAALGLPSGHNYASAIARSEMQNDARAALDALLAENANVKHGQELALLDADNERRIACEARAENQRLREALTEACDWLDADLAEHPGTPSDLQLADRELIARWREALAGDTE